MPHDATVLVCPATGLRLPEAARPSRPASRMTGEPPPSRRPEPLSAYDPARENRRPAPRAPSVPAPASGEHPQLLVGQTLGGRYRIRGILGEGGMGTVFDGEHLGLGRPVAIKVLSPAQAKKKVAVKRFQQEARAAGGIGHPNICEVYDFGLLEDGNPYLVMEKLVGQTLSERIAREGGLPFDDVVEVISQVLSGLIAAHEKGIIHRDIKPENIFLARRPGSPPIVKLLDFGVSKMMPEFQTPGDEALELTRTGMVMGTPYYMSPEQARGERNLDGRVDVYACGVVMYEAIAGKRPFLAPNYNALLLAIINTLPRPLRELRPSTPPEVEAIIARAMARNRNDRYPSARDMLLELTPSLEMRNLRRARMLGAPMAGEPLPVREESPVRAAPAQSSRASAPPSTLHSSRQEPNRPAARRKVESADSIDIPVHFSGTGSDEMPVDEDDATAVYRPPAPPRRAPAPAATAKKPETKSDEWEGETVVQRPTTNARPAPSRKPPAAPFNPEQTVRLDASELDEIQQHRVPPRRR